MSPKILFLSNPKLQSVIRSRCLCTRCKVAVNSIPPNVTEEGAHTCEAAESIKRGARHLNGKGVYCYNLSYNSGPSQCLLMSKPNNQKGEEECVNDKQEDPSPYPSHKALRFQRVWKRKSLKLLPFCST